MEWSPERVTGAPKGGPVSPVLSNIYLHYVLDLWFERRFKKSCRGFAELTRFADDFVAVFRNRDDAERFRLEMEERLAAFGLKVAPEKTALLCFDGNLLKGEGRPSVKPATFTFLGFTHFLTKARAGVINIVRTPSVKSRKRFIPALLIWLKANRHKSVWDQQAYLTKALNGYDQYFGLRLCGRKLAGVWHRVRKLWRNALMRRSQRARRRCDWTSLNAKLWFQLPRPRVTQAWV